MTNLPAVPDDAQSGAERPQDAILNANPSVVVPPAVTPQQQPIIVNVTAPVAALPPKETGTAYILWFFFGALGVHQFWLGNTGRGLLYLFTFGILGVGVIIDLFTLPGQVRAVNARRAAGIA